MNPIDSINENIGNRRFESEREICGAPFDELATLLDGIESIKRKLLRIDPDDDAKAALDEAYASLTRTERAIGRLLSPANPNEYNA